MTTRKAPKVSLRVAHSRSCANASKTALDSLKGCTCKPGPSYYTLHTPPNGRPVKGVRIRGRDDAEAEQTRLQHELNQGIARRGAPKSIAFGAWADKWAGILDLSNRRGSTRRAYVRSTEYAREVFGYHDLREIGNEQMRELVATLRDYMQDVTVAKHLRHLSACFEAAIDEDYLEGNPVSRFRRTFDLNVGESEANYFDDGELAAMWRQLAIGLPRKDGTVRQVAPVYLHLFRFAVVTGARLGELVALRWGDIRLGAGKHGEVRISKSWNPVDGEGPPKTRKSNRTIHMTADARRVLTEWAQLTGVQPDAALVFPSPRDGVHLSQSVISNRILNPAMVAAGIPKVGDDSPEPRSFHTLRHCYARLMLEQGQPMQWVADELGHESTATTERVYGHWGKQARRDTAASVPVGTFPV